MPCRRLAFAQAKAGDWAAAAGTQERLLARPGLPAAERIEVLGQRAYALSQLGRQDDAAAMLERVVAEPGGATPGAYERLAHAYAQAGRSEDVAGAQRRALAAPGWPAADWLSLARRLAILQQTLGRTEDAIATRRSIWGLSRGCRVKPSGGLAYASPIRLITSSGIAVVIGVGAGAGSITGSGVGWPVAPRVCR